MFWIFVFVHMIVIMYIKQIDMLKSLLPLLVVLIQGAHSGDKIMGKIYDEETKEELTGVRIISDCDTTYSDMFGTFQVKVLSDTSNLIFSLVSYDTDTLNVNEFYDRF